MREHPPILKLEPLARQDLFILICSPGLVIPAQLVPSRDDGVRGQILDLNF